MSFRLTSFFWCFICSFLASSLSFFMAVLKYLTSISLGRTKRYTDCPSLKGFLYFFFLHSLMLFLWKTNLLLFWCWNLRIM